MVVALREVAEFLAGQVLAIDVETVTFAQHFPRYVQPIVHPSFRLKLKMGACVQETIYARGFRKNVARSGLDAFCGTSLPVNRDGLGVVG